MSFLSCTYYKRALERKKILTIGIERVSVTQVLVSYFSRMFSGLRSVCVNLIPCKNSIAFSDYMAMSLTWLRSKPWYLFALIKSNKLLPKGSKTKHVF